VVNSVDQRSDAGVALDRAVATGATAVTPDEVATSSPDGVTLWLDAGQCATPIPSTVIAVLHAVAIEHGSFVTSNVSEADRLAPDQLAAVTMPLAQLGSSPGRFRQDAGAHRGVPPPAVWNLPPSAVSLVAFNKRAEEMLERTPRPAGDSRSHAQRDHIGHRQLGAVLLQPVR
jgi:hypothetical protein